MPKGTYPAYRHPKWIGMGMAGREAIQLRPLLITVSPLPRVR